MRDDEFDIGYWLLDDELIDRDGRRCGRVDDLEFDGEPGEQAVLAAILCGPGAWCQRVPRPFRPLVQRLFGEAITRVPWEEVADITVVVNLKRRAEDLCLGQGDDRVGRVVRGLPGS
jgi:sporulation protein YlmC with PRC-barrel domain